VEHPVAPDSLARQGLVLVLRDPGYCRDGDRGLDPGVGLIVAWRVRSHASPHSTPPRDQLARSPGFPIALRRHRPGSPPFVSAISATSRSGIGPRRLADPEGEYVDVGGPPSDVAMTIRLTGGPDTVTPPIWPASDLAQADAVMDTVLGRWRGH
jgi:hypothetical protein